MANSISTATATEVLCLKTNCCIYPRPILLRLVFVEQSAPDPVRLFALWMLVTRSGREWLWVVFILIFPVLTRPLYFFLVYRAAAGPRQGGFELPGARTRQRIKQLEDRIHHLGPTPAITRSSRTSISNRASSRSGGELPRRWNGRPARPDTLAHYGQCLLRLERAAEALPLLKKGLHRTS